MKRMVMLQGVRRMKFESVPDRWARRQLSQAEAAEVLGMSERTGISGLLKNPSVQFLILRDAALRAAPQDEELCVINSLSLMLRRRVLRPARLNLRRRVLRPAGLILI